MITSTQTPRSRTGSLLTPLTLLPVVALLVVGCSEVGADSEGRPEGGSSAAAATASADELLAIVGEDSLTVADVRASTSGSRLASIEAEYRRQRSELLENAVERLVRERLVRQEAERRDLTVDELLEAESNVSLDVSDEEVEAWYERNRPRLRGRSLASLRDQIEARLREQKRSPVIEGLVADLRERTDVEVFVEPYRVALDNAGAPAKGPEDAPVTLVEFSDFECPYCGRFYPTLKLLEQNYGDELRIVYRQFPLTNLHPDAWKAAEASLCAQEEGKFWQMHDRMFEHQEELDTPALTRHAVAIGLDREEFEECLASGRHSDRVQADLDEGRSVGVEGTPALFVNGIRVPGGAVPYRTVADAIDEELTRPER